MAMTTRDWVGFFEKAGIPSNEAATYALIFTQNRIQKNMLADINKEYLKDMGISLLGDVIAILKHAKHVHENNVRVGLLDNTAAQTERSEPDAAHLTGGTTAKELMDFYNQKYKEAEECLKVVMKTMPAKQKERLLKEAPLLHGVKLEPAYDEEQELSRKKKSQSKAQKEAIFNRLEKEPSTAVETSASKKTYSVFSRLGDLSSLSVEEVQPQCEVKETVVIRKSSTGSHSSGGVRTKQAALTKEPKLKEKDFLKAKSLQSLTITTQFIDDEDFEIEETSPKPVQKSRKPVQISHHPAPVIKRPIHFSGNNELVKETPSKKVRFGATSTKLIDDSKNPIKQPVFLRHSIVPKLAAAPQPRIHRNPVKSGQNPVKLGSKMVADSLKRDKQSSVRTRIGVKPNAGRKNNILDRLG